MSEINQEFLLDAVRKKREEQQAAELAQEQAEKAFTIEQFQSVVQAMGKATAALVEFLQANSLKVEVENPQESVATPDVSKVATAIGKLEKKLDKVKPADNKDIVDAVKDLTKAVDAQKPAPEAVEVTNITEMAKILSDGQKELTKALNKLELSPKITVPKPEVHIEPTDTKSIVQELKKVKKEIIEKPVPGTPTFIQDPLIRFTPANMDDSSTIQYYSYIATDGEFYIRKVDKSGSFTTIRFYFGKGDAATHDAACADRASLTYTMWAS